MIPPVNDKPLGDNAQVAVVLEAFAEYFRNPNVSEKSKIETCVKLSRITGAAAVILLAADMRVPPMQVLIPMANALGKEMQRLVESDRVRTFMKEFGL